MGTREHAKFSFSCQVYVCGLGRLLILQSGYHYFPPRWEHVCLWVCILSVVGLYDEKVTCSLCSDPPPMRSSVIVLNVSCIILFDKQLCIFNMSSSLPGGL